jgi:hypothetical protein
MEQKDDPNRNIVRSVGEFHNTIINSSNQFIHKFSNSLTHHNSNATRTDAAFTEHRIKYHLQYMANETIVRNVFGNSIIDYFSFGKNIVWLMIAWTCTTIPLFLKRRFQIEEFISANEHVSVPWMYYISFSSENRELRPYIYVTVAVNLTMALFFPFLVYYNQKKRASKRDSDRKASDQIRNANANANKEIETCVSIGIRQDEENDISNSNQRRDELEYEDASEVKRSDLLPMHKIKKHRRNTSQAFESTADVLSRPPMPRSTIIDFEEDEDADVVIQRE